MIPIAQANLYTIQRVYDNTKHVKYLTQDEGNDGLKLILMEVLFIIIFKYLYYCHL